MASTKFIQRYTFNGIAVLWKMLF